MKTKIDDFTPDLLGLLAIPNTEIHMEKGTYLFQEGDPAEGIFFIKEGKVRIGKTTPDGREITFRIIGNEEFIGEIPLFCSPSKYTVSAKVLEDGRGIKITRNEVEDALLCNPTLMTEYMRWMGILHQRNQTKIRDLVLHGKKGALYSTLIRMTNSFGSVTESGILIDIPITNQELADFCGMTREVVNRLLSELKKDGTISVVEGKLLIQNLDYLKQEIHCEDCPIEFCNIH